MYSRILTTTVCASLLAMGTASLSSAAKVPPERLTAPQSGQAESLYQQGRLQHAKGNLEAAIALYTEAINLDPESVEAYSARAGALGSMEDYEAAIADYTAAIELDDELAAAYGGRGWAQYLNGDLDAGVEDLWQAAQLFQEQNQTEQYFKTLSILKMLAP